MINKNRNFSARDFNNYHDSGPISEIIYEENIREDEPKELTSSDIDYQTHENDPNQNMNYNYDSQKNEEKNSPERNNDISNNSNKITNENFERNFSNTQNLNSISNIQKDVNTSYKDLLEQKIRNQAKRLCHLQDYKNLCEKRILQIFPGHPLPVDEKHLAMNSDSIQLTKSNNNNFTDKVMKNKGELEQNKIILDKIIFLENENNFLKQENYKLKNFPIFDLKSINETTNDNLKQSYLSLQNSFQVLQEEKETILNTLREETILNEEQRNYIEMLKQNIETNIFNNKLYNMLNSQKNLHYPKNAQIIDVVLDISRLQIELENTIRERNELQEYIKDLKKDNELTKNLNNELNNKRQRIIESLENGIKELEDAKKRVKILEQDKEKLTYDLNEAKEFNNKILNDYKSVLEKFNNVEKNNTEIEVIKSQLTNKTQENKNLLEEIKCLSEEKLLFEKKVAEVKSEFERLNLEKCQIDQISDEFLDNHKNLKNKFEELNKNYNQKLKLFDISEENLKKTESLLTDNVEKINNLTSEIEKYRNLTQDKIKKIDNLSKEKEEILNENQKIKTELLERMTEKKDLMIITSQQSNEINRMSNDLEILLKDKTEKKNIILKLKNDNENLNQEINKIKQEMKNEVTKLRSENHSLNQLLENNNKEIENMRIEFEKINQKQISKNLAVNNINENAKKEVIQFKKKIDELNFQIENFVIETEEKKILIRNFEKDIELIRSERDKYVKFYEKEKYENANNLNLIKLLEEEKQQQSKKEWNINKNSSIKISFNPFISNNTQGNVLENGEKIIDKNISNLKLGINNLLNIVDIINKKYHEKYQESLIKKQTNEFNIEKNFDELSEISLKKDQIKQHNENSKMVLDEEMKNFEEWLPLLKDELNSCFKSLEEYEAKQEIFKMNNSNEKKFKNDIELIEYEKQIHDMQNKNDELIKINLDFQNKNDQVNRQLKSYKNDNKKLYDQNKNLLEETKLKRIYERDFQFFENLLIKVLNNHPIPEIRGIANNIIDLFDYSNNIDKDKIKLGKKLEGLEKEYNIILSDPSRSEELEMSLKKQIHNMKNLVFDYEKKIQEKKIEISYIENKYFPNEPLNKKNFPELMTNNSNPNQNKNLKYSHDIKINILNNSIGIESDLSKKNFFDYSDIRNNTYANLNNLHKYDEERNIINNDNTSSTDINHMNFKYNNTNFDSVEFKENIPKEEIYDVMRSDFLNSNNKIDDINSFFASASLKNECLNNRDSMNKLRKINQPQNLKNNVYINDNDKPREYNNYNEMNNDSRKESSTFTFSHHENEIINLSDKMYNLNYNYEGGKFYVNDNRNAINNNEKFYGNNMKYKSETRESDVNKLKNLENSQFIRK